jgi:hypothetical protein
MGFVISTTLTLLISTHAGVLDDPTRPAQPASQPALTPAQAPTQDPVQAAAETDPALEMARRSAENFLGVLERADERISTIQGQLVWDKEFAIAGDTQTRIGKLYFSSPRTESGPRTRKFGVEIDTLVLGGRMEKKPESYIFDGEWLIEKKPLEKQAIKRRIVPPGEKFDPLKIGEGPFPIPIGQKKADILARYDARLTEVSDGLDSDEHREFAQGCTQIVLTPKPGADDKFDEIRLWYKPAEGVEGNPYLPRMARTVSVAGDISLIRLINMQANAAIPDGVLSTDVSEKDWNVQVKEYRESK